MHPRSLIKKASVALTLLFWTAAAHAQDLGGGTLNQVAGQANIKNDTSLPLIIGNLVRIFIGLLGIVFLVLTVYAGFLYLTARGEEDKVKHAKETLQRGVIGIIIISVAYALASFVISTATSVTQNATP